MHHVCLIYVSVLPVSLDSDDPSDCLDWWAGAKRRSVGCSCGISHFWHHPDRCTGRTVHLQAQTLQPESQAATADAHHRFESSLSALSVITWILLMSFLVVQVLALKTVTSLWIWCHRVVMASYFLIAFFGFDAPGFVQRFTDVSLYLADAQKVNSIYRLPDEGLHTCKYCHKVMGARWFRSYHCDTLSCFFSPICSPALVT